MSLLLHADMLKAHLATVAGLELVTVHVDRKFDIREMATAEFEKKTCGVFASISLGGWTPLNEDGGEGEYWASLRYEISFATIPHMLESLGLPTFDEMLRRLVVAIQGWRPSTANPAYDASIKWRVGAGSYVPDDSFLVYLFPATVEEDFAAYTAEE